MSHQVDRRTLVRWLLTHGFSKVPGKATGHSYYTNGATKISVVAHGPADITKKNVSMLVRQLAAAGFEKNKVLDELRSGRW